MRSRLRLLVIAVLACLAAPAAAQQQTVPALVLGAWQAALEDMSAGRPRAAIPVLEVLVRNFPGVTAFRLELALAYFQAQDAANATFHFNEALGGDLTEAQRVQVLRYLRAIEERRDWSATFSLSIIPESNPGRSTEIETITIGGIDFELAAPEPSGVGLRLGAGVAYTPRISRDVSALLALQLSGSLYENEDLNDISLRAEAGLIVRGDLGRQFSGGLYTTRRWIGGDGFTREQGVFGTFNTRLLPRTHLLLRGDFGRLTYDTLTSRDGDVLRLSASVTRSITPRLAIRGRASATRTDARTDFNSGRVLSAGIGVTYQLVGGWLASGDVYASRETRDGRSPLFVETRKDTEYTLVLRAMNHNLTYRGFTPVLEAGLQRHDSNIPIYEFRNRWVGLGLTRTF